MNPEVDMKKAQIVEDASDSVALANRNFSTEKMEFSKLARFNHKISRILLSLHCYQIKYINIIF